MKRLITSLIFALLLTNIFSQSPQYISYQAVVRNATGNILPNKLVSFKISILQGSALGSSIYAETHSKATNELGLVTLKVGGGTVLTGQFSNIDWALGNYFLKVELDVDADTNFAFMGTTQILSVPYALYAEKAGNAADDYDKDSLNEIQNINKVGNTVTLSKNGGSFIDSDNQTLSLSGSNLSISGGNSVQIGGTVDLDWDPSNELQLLSLSNDTLFLSQGNFVLIPKEVDTILWKVNGNDIFRPNGKVAIGTASTYPNPLGKLIIKADSYNYPDMISFRNYDDIPQWHLNLKNDNLDFVESLVSGGRLYLKKGGNVGIGTNNPLGKLHIKGDLIIEGSSTSNIVNSGDVGRELLMIRVTSDVTTGSAISLYGDNDNSSYPGALRFFTGNTTRMYIIQNGNIGIGYSTPSYQLHLSQNSAAKPTSNTWTVPSDKNLKTNINPYVGGLEEIKKINPVWFTYTGEAGMPKDTGIGVIAQELKEIAPYMVNEWIYKDENGKETTYLGVDNGAMTYMLINAVKALSEKVEALEKKLEEKK